MKRILFFIAAAAVLAACDKNENETRVDSGYEMLETSVLTSNEGYVNTLYDEVRVFTTADEFAGFCAANSKSAPVVDFSKNSVIVAAGVAPAAAQNVEASLSVQGGDFILKVAVNVSESEYVKPRVWDIMLQTPSALPDNVELKVSYDRIFDAAQLPDSTWIQWSAAGNGSIGYPLGIEENAYAVVVDNSNMDKVIQAINADEACIWVNCEAGMRRVVPFSVSKSRPETDFSNASVMILKDCDYDKVLRPVEDCLLYVGKGGTVVDSSTESQLRAFYGSGLHVEVAEGYDAALSSLMRSIGGEFEALPGDGAKFAAGWCNLYEGAKVNSLQLSHLLLRDGFLKSYYTDTFNMMINAYVYDSAVKKVY